MNFQPMQTSHLPEIEVIERQINPSPWSAEQFLQGLQVGFPPYRYTVGLEKNHIIGYCCGMILYDDFEIQNIGVQHSFQGQGWGSQLFAETLEWTKNQPSLQRILLEVRIHNTPALRLYKKFGFKEDGIRQKYYQDGEDALLMSYLIK
jgi:[ribosomal protein S18]-alanine N-acetyltransferase